MSNNSSASSNAATRITISFFNVLVFIVLKLLGKITWSWLWVLSPMWIVWGICLIILLIVGIIHLFTNY